MMEKKGWTQLKEILTMILPEDLTDSHEPSTTEIETRKNTISSSSPLYIKEADVDSIKDILTIRIAK